MRWLCRVLVTLVTSHALLHASAARADDRRKSGFDFMQPATQALQKDETQNPAMLWVKDGQALWSRPDGAAKKSCADCHGDLGKMRGIATRYPMYSTSQSGVINLGQQINQCRTVRQQAVVWPAENASLLAVEAAVAMESRGLAIAPLSQPQLSDAQKRGEALFNQRIGQIDLSCRDCHDTLAGKKLGGNTIPQAHPTGYPIYRLEWQAAGSLQRRLRGCMTAVRAEAYLYGSHGLTDLEAYLTKRAAGMTVESPGVRP
jgi:L-cysteine S-thiosulfotransferase